MKRDGKVEIEFDRPIPNPGYAPAKITAELTF